MTSRHIRKLFDTLAASEQEFLDQEFLAPVVRGSKVHVRIDGVVMRMNIAPENYRGFGVFCPVDHHGAILVRDASLRERQQYLKLLAQTSLILCRRIGSDWLAIDAHGGQGRLGLNAPVKVHLVDGANLFDTIQAGFDGTSFWYDRINNRTDAKTSAWLRESLEKQVDPKGLERSGLTPSQRAAYTLNFFKSLEERKQVRTDEIESRLRDALSHAGAEFVGYVEHKDGFRVTYKVGDSRHVSSVDKEDFAVQVAGICLSGQDGRFDLNSLVGVLRDNDSRYAVRVGNHNGGMSESEYWDIHPPEVER